MTQQIADLQQRLENVEDERKETKKHRTIAEILIPTVHEIRNIMIDEHIPDGYYCETIISALLLRAYGQNISWEISDFNSNYPRSRFDLNQFNVFESVIERIADSMRINLNTLLELLCIKFNHNQMEHDSIRNFIRDSNGNSSFNSYLISINITDVFTTNEKICLEVLYRRNFLEYYNSIQ
ncbi:hypothetical protein I4U23_010456 [Adineta vaga]|nr:hypothetical protein I4U23_010456 [Adineta vaga]